jgi:hypothetical protein
VSQRLVDDAVALGEAQQRLELLGGRLGVQVEGQADGAEPDGCVLAHGQGAAEVQVALGGEGATVHGDAQRGGDGPQRDPGAGHQRLQQHVPGAQQGAVPAGGRVQARHRQLAARVHRARDGLLLELAAGPQGDQRLVRIAAIGVLERLLHQAEFCAVHVSAPVCGDTPPGNPCLRQTRPAWPAEGYP